MIAEMPKLVDVLFVIAVMGLSLWAGGILNGIRNFRKELKERPIPKADLAWAYPSSEKSIPGTDLMVGFAGSMSKPEAIAIINKLEGDKAALLKLCQAVLREYPPLSDEFLEEMLKVILSVQGR